jgi:hypothetical protein
VAWATGLHFEVSKPEALSRVDLAFDYHLPHLDFDVDGFVTLATKDSKYRQDGQARGFTSGKGDIVLRVYDKVTEIEEQSKKVWFFQRWGRNTDVWRIEWQWGKILCGSLFEHLRSSKSSKAICCVIWQRSVTAFALRTPTAIVHAGSCIRCGPICKHISPNSEPLAYTATRTRARSSMNG